MEQQTQYLRDNKLIQADGGILKVAARRRILITSLQKRCEWAGEWRPSEVVPASLVASRGGLVVIAKYRRLGVARSGLGVLVLVVGSSGFPGTARADLDQYVKKPDPALPGARPAARPRGPESSRASS